MLRRARAGGCGSAGRSRASRRDYTTLQAHAAARLRPARAGALRLPRRAAGADPRRAIDALMAHWRLVTPALVRAVARPAASSTCGPWTTRARIAALEAAGVTGVITNDPRLFGLGDLAGGGAEVARLGARRAGVTASVVVRVRRDDLRAAPPLELHEAAQHVRAA